MNVAAFAVYVIIVIVVTSLTDCGVSAARCQPGINCRLPRCRCWQDRAIPGGFEAKNTPQMVLLNFGNSINSHTKEYPLRLLNGLTNPNGCPISATFFIENSNTEPSQVSLLHRAGFEVALSTDNDTIPDSPLDWQHSIKRVKDRLVTYAGIPARSMQGFRATQLYEGGDDALDALPPLDLTYDATCVTKQFVDTWNLLWPYTYDFAEQTPHCSIGKTPRWSHNGTWQFLLPDLTLSQNGTTHNCPSPSSCSRLLPSEKEVFDFLLHNFLKYYEGSRAPMNLYLDPLWLSGGKESKGTRRFLNFLLDIKDVWLVTFQQAMQWMSKPVSSQQAYTFYPWQCSSNLAQLRDQASQ